MLVFACMSKDPSKIINCRDTVTGGDVDEADAPAHASGSKIVPPAQCLPIASCKAPNPTPIGSP